jgi:hypothetical protein
MTSIFTSQTLDDADNSRIHPLEKEESDLNSDGAGDEATEDDGFVPVKSKGRKRKYLLENFSTRKLTVFCRHTAHCLESIHGFGTKCFASIGELEQETKTK